METKVPSSKTKFMRTNALIFLVFKLHFGFSQTEVSDYLYSFELEKSQEETWKKEETIWLENVFYPYIKKSKIKLSDCYKCGNLYIDVEATIDANGKLTIDNSISKKCGKPMDKKLQQYLMQYFISNIFPENLRNLKIQHRFGVLYKC